MADREGIRYGVGDLDLSRGHITWREIAGCDAKGWTVPRLTER